VLLFSMLLVVQSLFADQMVLPSTNHSVTAELSGCAMVDGVAAMDDCESTGTECLFQAMAGGCGVSYCPALVSEVWVSGDEGSERLKTSFSNNYRSVVLDLLTYPPNSFLV
tara:strand:- start:2576 stop:2908 length:333 start_codon:yes stop_codon:yes gene_type:complete